MRALSSISILVSTLLTAAACTDGGAGPSGPARVLVVAPTAATLQGGKTLQLNLWAQDAEGKTVKPTNVTWVSSNPRIADVNGGGLVTAFSSGGSDITVYWAGISGRSRITVAEPIQSTPCSTGGDEKNASAGAGEFLKACLHK